MLNSVGDLVENDGVTRILAVTEGVDASGNPARVWSVTSLVFSGIIAVCEAAASSTSLAPGESSTISFKIYDENGNPIVPGSEIAITVMGGALSWSNLTTDDPGITHYSVSLTNNLDPSDPDAREIFTPVTISVTSQNGRVIKSTEVIHLRLN
ncbi:Ig-like domain-containing protein [bacterium]|nr:Ig-like domain-containing protein [bacterium]